MQIYCACKIQCRSDVKHWFLWFLWCLTVVQWNSSEVKQSYVGINACLPSTYNYEKEIHCGSRISEGHSYIFMRVIFSHYLCRNTLSWLNNVFVSADSEQRLHRVVWWAFLYSTGSSGGGGVQPAFLSIWSGLGWKEHQCRAGWTQTVWSGPVHKAFQCLVVPPGHQ